MRVLPLVLVMSMSPVAQTADNPQQVFNEIFGERVKGAKSSRTSEDDVALAKEILQSAIELKADKSLRVMMFNHAYDLGKAGPQGYDTALEAMKHLAQQFPTHAQAASDKSFQLVNAAYRSSRGTERVKFGQMLVDYRSDAAFTLLEAGNYRAALASFRQALSIARLIRSDSANAITRRIEQSKKLLRARHRKEVLDKQVNDLPVDKDVVRELVQICVAKFNEPAAAQIYAPLLDADTKQKLALALKPMEELMPADCLSLGLWYADFASSENSLIKLTNLEHAAAYLTRFIESLDANAPRSVDALKAELALKAARAEIEKLREVADVKSRWIDLTQPFAKLIAANQGELYGGATARHNDGVFTLEGEFARIAAPVPEQNFIFSVEVRKLDGQYVAVQGRVTEDASLFVEMANDSQVFIKRWLRGSGRTELTKGVFKTAFDGDFHEFRFAILGDTIIAHLDGKEILRVKNHGVMKAGNAGIAVRQARAEFRKPRMTVPSDRLVKELLSKGKKR